MAVVNSPISDPHLSPPVRAAANDDPLTTPAQFVPGVGPARAKLLAKLELHTVADLLWYLPRDILDLTEVRALADLKEGEMQTVRGMVVDLDGRQLTGGRSISAVLLDCGGDYLRGTWFNQTWVLQKFRPGQVVLFSGKPKRRGKRWEIAHPRIQWIDDDDAAANGGIQTRYGLTEGLKMHEMRRLVRAAVEGYAHFVPEYLPADFRETQRLPELRQAIRQLHCPSTREEYESARRRLIFDDLLEFQLGLAIRRRAWQRGERAASLPATPKIDARIRRLFPFRFTAGQDRAVREIAADLDSGIAMHRLLQADVGAGKTAVAIYAMLVAIAAGYQAVLMAPTEVLASQHWATIEQILAHSRVERLLLTGNLTPARRKEALAAIAAGKVQLVVGTQAVIQRDVRFHRLGLVVVDEQHKFGVMQRARFSAGDVSPHVLVMTATPIPRSLCLTQFGDLDITSVAELPPGRQRVVTSRVPGPQARQRAWEFVRNQLRSGRQAFVVCPRIEADTEPPRSVDFNPREAPQYQYGSQGETQPSPGVDSNPHYGTGPEFVAENDALDAGAEQVYRQLSAGELKDFRVGLVHGQMDRRLKAEAMEAFRDGRTQVLVSTTVVEVGVDVPNATLMIIYQAERFGLSQLHQLRGRISRGKFQGYCFLFSDSDSEDATTRLSALESTSDGFKIAEVDFELRGPGDVLGTRQHGEMPLKVADLSRDHEVLLEARTAAFDLVKSGEFDAAEFTPLKVRVLERFGKLMDLPKSG